MSAIQIIDIILIIVLFICGIEFMIKLKKSEEKEIEKVRDSLIKRINIITILIATICVLSIVNIIVKKLN